MAWRVFSVSTADWQSKVQLFPAAAPWGRALNSGKNGTAKFMVCDPKVAKTANKTTLDPWSRLLVFEFYGQIVHAGFITNSVYDKDAGTVDVTHEDLWTVLNKRLMAGLIADGVQTTAIVYTGISLVDIAAQGIYQAQNDSAIFNLPIVLPTYVPGSGPENRKYEGFQLPTAADVVEEAMNTEGGPDVDLFPRWRSDTSVEWYFRAGNLTTGTWSWRLDSKKTQVSGLKVRTDGAMMANRIVAVGEGSEKKMLLSVADGTATSGFLPLDAMTSYKKEKSQTNLAARARADLAARSKPTVQVSMDIQMNENFSVDQLQLGGTVKWHTQNDPWEGTGWNTSRLIEFSGDLSLKVHLEFQTAAGG